MSHRLELHVNDNGISALFLSEFDEIWWVDRVSHPEQKLQLQFSDCPTASPEAKFRRMPQSFIVKLFHFLRYMRVLLHAVTQDLQNDV